MDAIYLKDNVEVALSEALTSMVVASPDDSIEYIANYLLAYVDRKSNEEKVSFRLSLNY